MNCNDFMLEKVRKRRTTTCTRLHNPNRNLTIKSETKFSLIPMLVNLSVCLQKKYHLKLSHNIIFSLFLADSTNNSFLIYWFCSIYDAEFRMEHIQKILLKLHNENFLRLAGIPAIFFENLSPELVPIPRHLMQISYKSGWFPNDWKILRITPIPWKV